MQPNITALTACLILCAQSFGSAADTAKPNVLFIAVDDLNHWVGHLGRNKQTKTPNIDRLAAMGVTFTNESCILSVPLNMPLNMVSEKKERHVAAPVPGQAVKAASRSDPATEP